MPSYLICMPVTKIDLIGCKYSLIIGKVIYLLISIPPTFSRDFDALEDQDMSVCDLQ